MKILLALDHSTCSEAAIEAVISQFAAAGPEVRVFHAIDWEAHLPISYQFAEGPHSAMHVMSARDDMLQAANAYVSTVVQRLQAAGCSAISDISAEGEPREAILQAAAAWPADLIVVGSHGRRGLDRLFLGSVSAGVLRGASCPVQVVRAPHTPESTAGTRAAAVKV